MCGLFGFSDPFHVLTPKQLRKLTAALAIASEERGTDASGIAYVQAHKLRIYKRPKAAHAVPWFVPAGTTAVMGHTRMATQGNPNYNPNNHPFPGVCGETRFALAHNGVLRNDEALKRKYHLPKSPVQTDSYVAVQLLEQQGNLDAQSIGNVAALLKGSFSLSVLDGFNHLYLVKGNSPLYVCRFENGLLCYTSTAAIFQDARKRAPFLPKEWELIGLSEGDVLCIRPDGRLQMSRFCTDNLQVSFRWWKPERTKTREADTPLDQLLETAGNLGFHEEDVLTLLEEGYCEEELEEMLCQPGLFYGALMEAAYGHW